MTAEGAIFARCFIFIMCFITFSFITIRIFNRKSKSWGEFWTGIGTVPIMIFTLCS